jgi:hypothetical protein
MTSNAKTSANSKTLLALILIILVLSGSILYLILRPINAYNQLKTVRIINKATETVDVPPNELPQVGVIGDEKNLQSIEKLKAANAVDAEIYKDAENGDYVLGYTSKLIIYRPSTKEVVYEGETPQQKLAETQKTLISLVQKKAVEEGLIKSDTAVPQASIVTEAEKVKQSNEFYSDVENNDIIANFSNPDLIVIYRPSNDTIVKSGKISISN